VDNKQVSYIALDPVSVLLRIMCSAFIGKYIERRTRRRRNIKNSVHVSMRPPTPGFSVVAMLPRK